jgi:hypothetical protein
MPRIDIQVGDPEKNLKEFQKNFDKFVEEGGDVKALLKFHIQRGTIIRREQYLYVLGYLHTLQMNIQGTEVSISKKFADIQDKKNLLHDLWDLGKDGDPVPWLDLPKGYEIQNILKEALELHERVRKSRQKMKQDSSERFQQRLNRVIIHPIGIRG